MRQVTIHLAKAQLSQLIKAALEGEDVVIARGSIPVVRLVPVVERTQTFKMGLLANQLGEVPDFLLPMDEGELELWEGGG